MIRHTVIFTLMHPHGSPEEQAFLHDARTALVPIPGVEKFEQLRQLKPRRTTTASVSRWNSRTSRPMSGYDRHPSHVAFVQDRWNREVESFLEIDYELL